MVGQLSRSLGSTTASRNRFGSYFRNRVMPVNPKTDPQSVRRNEVQELSQAYRSLTDAQRAAWRNLGTSMVRTDSLGQTYTLTGLQAYTSVNLNLLTYGGARVSDAPALGTVTTLSTITANAADA